MIFQLGKSKNDANRPVEAETIQRWREIASGKSPEATTSSSAASVTSAAQEEDSSRATSLSSFLNGVAAKSGSQSVNPVSSQTADATNAAKKGFGGSTPRWTEELRETMKRTQPATAQTSNKITASASKAGLGGSSTGLLTETRGKKDYGEVRSALGPGTMIEGKLSFDSPVRIDGSLKGEVTSSSLLIVGEQAVINAVVNVGSLVVHGQVSGAVQAQEFVEIRDGGVLQANIQTGRLIIENGGFFRGGCNK